VTNNQTEQGRRLPEMTTAAPPRLAIRRGATFLSYFFAHGVQADQKKTGILLLNIRFND
jgi:hypothetical protein